MKKKRKILLGIVASIVLTTIAVVLSISSTQALYTQRDTSTRKSNYGTGILSITAISKSDKISLNGALPITDEQGVTQDPYTFTIKNNGNVDYQFDVQLLAIGENTFDPQYIKLKVDNDAVTTLSTLTNSKIKTGLTLGAQQTVDISLRVWLASNTPNTQIGKTFTSQLVINGIAVSPTSNYGVSAAAYITNLYNNATKTVVTNNSIDYNYATSVSLMNDRLGGTTKDLNAGNIRYYGANPNNYIWLGETYETACSDEVCGTARTAGARKLYRIIGVFDNMLKVVAVDSIGYYSWDTSDSLVNDGDGINEWTQADLMKLLNPGYESDSVNNSLYWNKGSGNCYAGKNNTATPCDFSNIGLSDSVKNKIATVTWNLGATNIGSDDYYSDYFYEYERGTTHVTNPSDGITREDTWTGKVGLIYISDYGYAANFSLCQNKKISEYDDQTCTSNEWLNFTDYWTISSASNSNYSAGVWFIYGSGGISTETTYYSDDIAVHPVLYLNAEESIASGTGTSTDPYVLR